MWETDSSDSSQYDGDRPKPGLLRPDQFQFINLNLQLRADQAENRRLVRSHISKSIQRAQRAREKGPRRKLDEKPKDYQQNHDQQNHGAIDHFFRNSTWIQNSVPLSTRPAIEQSISALKTYKMKVTPHLHELLGQHGRYIWDVFYPPEGDVPSILTRDWFSLIQTCPAMFHGACYRAANCIDIMRGYLYYSITPEIRMHKIEAIRLINEELTKSEEVPEGIILAATSFISEAIGRIGTVKTVGGSAPSKVGVSQIKTPLFLRQWEEHFLGVRCEGVHFTGLKAIVRMKGGIDKLQERTVATAVSYNSLVEASFVTSKPPDVGFYALPQVLNRARDQTRNVPSHISIHQGGSLDTLLSYGLTKDALAVMMDMSSVSSLVQDYLQGSLKNPDLLAIICMRDQAHHKVLSLPTGRALFGPSGETSFYECCRLTALLYSMVVLFPMPPSTGISKRLISQIKHCVDQTSFLVLVSEGARPFFIWVLMLASIAEGDAPERQWFEETLTNLFAIDGVSRWSELKKIVESFLWMESACDSAAMELWDNMADSLRGK